jgi:dipeptidase E
MKRLFLTSSVNFVARDIAKRINQKNLKLLFVLTPTEIEEGDLQWLKDDRQSLVDAGFLVTDYTITGKTQEEVQKALDETDVLYMSGGNTFWFLSKVQESNCADAIRDFVASGKIYISTSAGSILAGPDILPTRNLEKFKKVPKLENYKGLCLVDFLIMPHWGSESFKTRYVNERLEHTYTEDYSIILLPNDSYIMVEGDKYKIIKVKQNV